MMKCVEAAQNKSRKTIFDNPSDCSEARFGIPQRPNILIYKWKVISLINKFSRRSNSLRPVTYDFPRWIDHRQKAKKVSTWTSGWVQSEHRAQKERQQTPNISRWYLMTSRSGGNLMRKFSLIGAYWSHVPLYSTFVGGGSHIISSFSVAFLAQRQQRATALGKLKSPTLIKPSRCPDRPHCRSTASRFSQADELSPFTTFSLKFEMNGHRNTQHCTCGFFQASGFCISSVLATVKSVKGQNLIILHLKMKFRANLVSWIRKSWLFTHWKTKEVVTLILILENRS